MATEYYAVASGHKRGIYTDWSEAGPQVIGYSGCVHKKFQTLKEAEEFMERYEQTTEDIKLAQAMACLYVSPKKSKDGDGVDEDGISSEPVVTGRVTRAMTKARQKTRTQQGHEGQQDPKQGRTYHKNNWKRYGHQGNFTMSAQVAVQGR